MSKLDDLIKNNLHRFNYDNGKLYWVDGKRTGKIAGTVNSDGHIQIKINNSMPLAHRIVWLMFNNSCPKMLDHIDRNPSNNLIENLREATNQQNQQNAKKSKRNFSGIKGVVWNKNSQKWQTQLTINKKLKYFGLYFDKEIARFVVETMRYKYHGKFANQE